ncbi:hypothetical protein EVG20_g3408 [Dentipellis fragilis]|uniref:alpha-amylase n=1 Tax=Dentipellis fragilis TaxID=205917 RepID=A0A4Y9Z428_9AGAM|nr:hypothetical protein EVG20_g3408 [Dentipellis fragilis]
MKNLLSLVLSSLLMVSSTLAATPDEWRGKAIYQLITDRFAVADNSPPPCDTLQLRRCGGTWKGVTKYLDYIQGMGFDAVWISPIQANLDGVTTKGEAYHGYWVQDLGRLDPHFGTEDDLKELIKALHDRGMYIMIDVVVNHMTAPAMPPQFDFKNFFHPFSDQSYFRPPKCWTNGSMELDILQNCWLGDPTLPMPDLDTDQQRVVELLYQSIHDLVQKFDIDGLRVDTVKYIKTDFWPGWVKSAGVYSIGEIFSNDTTFVQPWTEVMDGVMDYPTFFYIRQAFEKAEGPIQPFVDEVLREQKGYKNGLSLLGSFLENHNNPRFMNVTQDMALAANVMTFPFVHDGTPIVYYGQEQGYSGGEEPFNREALWLSAYQVEKPMYQHFKKLNAARKAAAAWSKEFLSTPLKFLSVERTSFAVLKPPMLALLTNAGNHSYGITWTVPDAGFSTNEVLVDVLTCNIFKANEDGGVVARSAGACRRWSCLHPWSPKLASCAQSWRKLWRM